VVSLIAVAVMAAGAIAVAVAWRLVAARGLSVWPVMTWTLGLAAAASLATGQVKLSPNVAPGVAALAGLASAVALYAGTAVFLLVARRVSMFERHVEEIYDLRRGLSLPAALALAGAVVAPCEEIFWRGLFQGRLSTTTGAAAGAGLTLLVYVLANAASASLPITLAAVVSGAVWGALAWWTHGVLASLVCHSLWTVLMIALPPGHPPEPGP
jgi:membrane protease YdiL (CAAX protease family)